MEIRSGQAKKIEKMVEETKPKTELDRMLEKPPTRDGKILGATHQVAIMADSIPPTADVQSLANEDIQRHAKRLGILPQTNSTAEVPVKK